MKKPPFPVTNANHDFINRHIGPRPEQQKTMLSTLGFDNMDAFIHTCVPQSIRSQSNFELDAPVTEPQALTEMANMAAENQPVHYMLGGGYSPAWLPPVLQRNFLENPGWYTAYTPYQSEISQGRLQLLLNFQQMIIELTNLDLANASLLDEATAAAEAVMLAHRAQGTSKRNALLIDQDCHPQTISVVRTRCAPANLAVHLYDTQQALPDNDDVFALLVQYPGTSGRINDHSTLFTSAKARNICTIVSTDPMALAIVRPPGDFGADIAVGTTQRFGLPLGFGGPHAGFIACREHYKRHMPGRIIGLSKDVTGKPALRMALQTREQHIRREKATSNICTAQVLLANLSALYAQYHGPDGLRRIALHIHRMAQIIAIACANAGMKTRHSSYFDSIIIETGENTEALYTQALKAGYCLKKSTHTLQISCGETTTIDHVRALIHALTGKTINVDTCATETDPVIPHKLLRHQAPLRHSIFTTLHTETEMMRYLKALEHKDITLNRSMIPLGSCTMKLNATTELMPITWPGFADVHPFAPPAQHKGYTQLITSLEKQLCVLTGFSRVSMQPNSGAQGEYAGLTAIRSYHNKHNHHQRDICLIPSSAHGTNPASAHMAGMKVIVIHCDTHGNVDLNDLQYKAQLHKERLAALMITYPSTHGVFEENIHQLCAIVHDNGGLVYMDGANTNAMVGIVKPAELGADVMHLNLHKTFCIPHGGGGPGAGPIGVNEKLVDFLPGHPAIANTPDTTIAAAPWGSALILPVSWAYIRMMGHEGLKQATQIALLNANYIAHRLKEHYPILYTGTHGLVAHECIIDLRPLKHESGISEEDIAKRLIDYGFHAPTMSFPVSGTLMIEPTESESLTEIDRFCHAMIQIRQEIKKVSQGAWPLDDNPLVNAPHTADEIAQDNWTHPYSREQACYPANWVKDWKFWPPVKRVDNRYGDKHFCACLTTETTAVH